MITLPDTPAPNGLRYSLLDYGFTQRGAASLRVDRAGGRYRIEVSYPPMPPETARVFLARLQRAKRDGVEIVLPLLGVSQGSPGSPVLDGAGQSGSAVLTRGFTHPYLIKEGWWLTLSEADGTAYLHQVVADVATDSEGNAYLQIEPPLRAPFPDGAVIEMAAPFVQGFIDGESLDWDVPLDRFIAPSFVMEEFA